MILILSAVVFTVGLTVATLEAPRWLNTIMADFLDFPDYNPFMDYELIEEFMTAWHIREIGYGCLGVLSVLIVAGFLTGKMGLSSLGSFAFFLPTFGYFVGSMFFLTGIGMLRLAWLPFWDPSTDLLKLGDIVYLPYMIVTYPFAVAGLDVRRYVPYVAVGFGLLIFLIGTIAWLYGKFQRKGTVDFWLYRYSRHPQYIGFIIWSYGVMLLAALSPTPFGGVNPGASLPWLISLLLVACVALGEEMKMARIYGKGYLDYRKGAPFMLPLPGFVSAVIKAPMRLVLRKDSAENLRELVYTFCIYGTILVALSLPFFLLHWPPGLGWFEWPYSIWPLSNPGVPHGM